MFICSDVPGYIKAGPSTADAPSLLFPTVVGRPRRRFEEMYSSKDPRDRIFVGEEAIANRQHLTFANPIDHGHIDNWIEVTHI